MQVSQINCPRLRDLAEQRRTTPADDLWDAFNWNATDEGFEFWRRVYSGEITSYEQALAKMDHRIKESSATVADKTSDLISTLRAENALLHRTIRAKDSELSRLRDKLFHLTGQMQPAFTPNELIEAPKAVNSGGLGVCIDMETDRVKWTYRDGVKTIHEGGSP